MSVLFQHCIFYSISCLVLLDNSGACMFFGERKNTCYLVCLFYFTWPTCLKSFFWSYFRILNLWTTEMSNWVSSVILLDSKKITFPSQSRKERNEKEVRETKTSFWNSHHPGIFSPLHCIWRKRTLCKIHEAPLCVRCAHAQEACVQLSLFPVSLLLQSSSGEALEARLLQLGSSSPAPRLHLSVCPAQLGSRKQACLQPCPTCPIFTRAAGAQNSLSREFPSHRLRYCVLFCRAKMIKDWQR